MKRKIILGISLFLMLLTLFALSINAAKAIETWDISATSSNNVTATLYDDYSLVISGTGKMRGWELSKDIPWFSSYHDQIKSVTIEDGVTNVGDKAIYLCSSLTSVVIPDSVTAIGEDAFEYCDSLTSVELPDSVTTIGNGAFAFCKALTKVIIPGSVKTIGEYAFYSCYAVKSIVIDYGVTTINYAAFADCKALTSIVIPDSVTSIGKRAFEGCHSLTIYAEAPSQPSGWIFEWNYENRPVVWGYFDKEACMEEIFTFLGYSFNENVSMAVGYEINYEALKKYEEKTGETLSIGVVFASYDLLGGQNPVGNDGKAITLPVGNVAQRDITDLEYGYYDFIINGIDDSLKDYSLVTSAYIYNGETVKYVQENGICDTVTGITYNEAKEGQL